MKDSYPPSQQAQEFALRQRKQLLRAGIYEMDVEECRDLAYLWDRCQERLMEAFIRDLKRVDLDPE